MSRVSLAKPFQACYSTNMGKRCRTCNVELVLEGNWTAGKAAKGDYQCRQCNKAQLIKWKQDNPNRIKEVRKELRKKHKKSISLYNKKYYKSREDEMRKRAKKYREDNPDVVAAQGGRRRAAKFNATLPGYSDQIRLIYKQAKEAEKATGTPHHVDHIYPLKHKDFCGLHVPWNLCTLTASENMQKGNTRPEEIECPNLQKKIKSFLRNQDLIVRPGVRDPSVE